MRPDAGLVLNTCESFPGSCENREKSERTGRADDSDRARKSCRALRLLFTGRNQTPGADTPGQRSLIQGSSSSCQEGRAASFRPQACRRRLRPGPRAAAVPSPPTRPAAHGNVAGGSERWLWGDSCRCSRELGDEQGPWPPGHRSHGGERGVPAPTSRGGGSPPGTGLQSTGVPHWALSWGQTPPRCHPPGDVMFPHQGAWAAVPLCGLRSECPSLCVTLP